MKPEFTIRIAATIIALASAAASAGPPSFQITRIFSNMDGTVQFIQLQESAGLDGQQHFAGLTLTSTSARGGVTKQITFPLDLANDHTAKEYVLIATETNWVPGVPYYNDFLALEGEYDYFAPDFVIPVRFIPTEGGTIDFAGVDQVSYPALPIDGWHGVSRNGTPGEATFLGFHRVPRFNDNWYRPAKAAQTGSTAIEYYNAKLDHYFVSGSAPDIDAIESGRLQGWAPTGQTFVVAEGKNQYWADSNLQPPGLLEDPVCRFYIPPSEGDSHFYSAAPEECDAVKARFPEFVLESNAAFYAILPDQATGVCPSVRRGLIMVLGERCFGCGTSAPTPITDTRLIPSSAIT